MTSSATSSTSPLPSFFTTHRNAVIAGSVLVFHAMAIWALQTGLIMRAVEIIVPVEVLAQIIDLPTPKVTPAPPAPPEPVKQVAAKPTQPAQASPSLLAGRHAAPTPYTPSALPMSPPAPYTPTVPVAAVATPAPPAPAKITLPSSDADYLSNPKPTFPPMSRRLSEQGNVLVRVLIGTDGLPKKAEIKKSSGFERLDKAAQEYVMKCRFVPGKVGVVPQEMWYDAPVNYVLD